MRLAPIPGFRRVADLHAGIYRRYSVLSSRNHAAEKHSLSQRTDHRLVEPSEPVTDRLSALSHDLRHCLHVMRIGRELLSGSLDTGKRREVCDSLEQEELKATQLLDELVELARARHVQG
jgi:signal transduction histidine kinase